jgi:hypothetical protein
MEESTIANDNPAGLTIGAIVASAAIAGLVAFFLRRSMHSNREDIVAQLKNDLTDGDLKDRATAATGEFLRSHLAPEIRPVLLTMLADVREYVDKGFQRAERSIKDL